MTAILQLKVFVDGIMPRIWRRFLVKDTSTFHDLHKALQVLFGWSDSHLYAFYVAKEELGIPDDFRENFLNAKKIRLKDKLSLKQKFGYVYDFGDNWEHVLTVEKAFDAKDAAPVPRCVGGERSGPPEDCGSYPGYYSLMEIQKNKKHPDYQERIVEWLGTDFDFEHFDIGEINKELLTLAKKRAGRNR